MTPQDRRWKTLSVALFAALFLLSVNATGVHAQYPCAQCTEMACAPDEHANEECPWCFYGNVGYIHTCWPYSCMAMISSGVHLNNILCEDLDDGGFATLLDELRSLPTISTEDLPALLTRYPDRLVTSEGLGVLQVLGCDLEMVIAQFPLRERRSEPKAKSRPDRAGSDGGGAG